VTLARPESPRTSSLHRISVKRRVEISTTHLTDTLTQVSTPGEVLGFIRVEWNGYAALRGAHLASAQLVGCYASRGLALEALRQKPRTI